MGKLIECKRSLAAGLNVKGMCVTNLRGAPWNHTSARNHELPSSALLAGDHSQVQRCPNKTNTYVPP